MNMHFLFPDLFRSLRKELLMLSKPHLRQCVIVIDFCTHTAFDIAVDAEVNLG